jgi:methyl-accepting chemotaxis protein
VASEVKDLATQTASATDAISQQIAAIQLSTARAVGTINAISQRIHTINDTTAAVSGMVEQQGVATLDIVNAVRQASVGTGEVTTNIKTVSNAAHETEDAAGKVLTAASDLTTQSDRLRREVRTFLASVRTA